VRAVLDPNVIISALLSSTGAPAALLTAWGDGAYELVVSPALLSELERALAYPKLRQRIPAEAAAAVLVWLRASAITTDDPDDHPLTARSRDPGDDYLLALAVAAKAILVTGDGDLLELGEELPIHTPQSFVALLRV
jgi:putative PIN family toxin of toxin-antitoxin system